MAQITAERLIKMCRRYPDARCSAEEKKILIAEIDRLRAEVKQLEAEILKWMDHVS